MFGLDRQCAELSLLDRTSIAQPLHQADVIQRHSAEAVVQLGRKDHLQERLRPHHHLTFDPAVLGGLGAAPLGARVGLVTGHVDV